jgi:hypothetical protein
VKDESPQARVDFYVDSHMRHAKAIGAEADAEVVRRGTVRLLEAADAELRNGLPTKSRRPHKDKAAVLAEKRAQQAEALASRAGVEFFYRDERPEPLIERPKVQAAPTEGAKHVALITRIRLLMQRIPGYRLKPGESVYAAHIYPRFAQLLDQHTKNAALTDPRSHGLGVYAERPIHDRVRMYYRNLEAICSASDPVIGRGWWIPK